MFNKSFGGGPGPISAKWRIYTLVAMGTSLVCVTIALGSTDWREDNEPWLNIKSTYGAWRICRDIKFGATLDHQCFTSLTNNAPLWFQCFRGFMCLALLLVFIAFLVGIKTVTSIPPEGMKGDEAPSPLIPSKPARMLVPALLMFCGAFACLMSVGTFAVATHLERALYYPPNLAPTWADSWAQVWAKLQSQPQNRVKYKDMDIQYGYSFAIGCLGVISSFASFVLNVCAKP